MIPVGAEEGLFDPQPVEAARRPVRVLFYGSFIGLQGPEVIAQAAALTAEVHWTFIGDGPLRQRCEHLCKDRPNITFLPWIPYQQLPAQIAEADILMGVFGNSQKAARVIPNKVYQSLACGRIVVTQPSPSYPEEIQIMETSQSGIAWVAAGNAGALAEVVRKLAAAATALSDLGDAARRTYERHFSAAKVRKALSDVLVSGLKVHE